VLQARVAIASNNLEEAIFLLEVGGLQGAHGAQRGACSPLPIASSHVQKSPVDASCFVDVDVSVRTRLFNAQAMACRGISLRGLPFSAPRHCRQPETLVGPQRGACSSSAATPSFKPPCG
jgi:hypothetical protein